MALKKSEMAMISNFFRNVLNPIVFYIANILMRVLVLFFGYGLDQLVFFDFIFLNYLLF